MAARPRMLGSHGRIGVSGKLEGWGRFALEVEDTDASGKSVPIGAQMPWPHGSGGPLG